jgi:hypothetical protein
MRLERALWLAMRLGRRSHLALIPHSFLTQRLLRVPSGADFLVLPRDSCGVPGLVSALFTDRTGILMRNRFLTHATSSRLVSLLVGAALLCAIPAQASAQRKAAGVRRDSHGKIARSSKAKDQFKKQTGYPHGRPGYVIDHVVPLSRGGSDSPGNMQWQSKSAAKEKDRWERGGSRSGATYRSRSYSRKSYAPKHRAPRAAYRTYHAPRSTSHSRYRASRRRH